MDRSGIPRVVVGIDGTATGTHSVVWAAAEASAREQALSIVHAVPGTLDDAARVRVGTLLDLGRAVALDGRSSLAVSTELVEEEPATALLDAAEDAVMLVASLDSTTLADSILGSIGLDLLGLASCPVAVVRPPDALDGAVVVTGVEPSRDNSATLAAAFAAAAAHRLPLTALYVQDRGSPPTRGCVHDEVRVWAVAHPSVDVEVTCPHGDPANVLASASQGARMLVVGRPGGRDRGLFGGTTRSLAWNSRCPVLVARAATEPAPHTAQLVGSTDRGTQPPRM